MLLTKPPGIESDPFKSAKWDELTEGRRFAQSDAPALSLLCQWHKIVYLATDNGKKIHLKAEGGACHQPRDGWGRITDFDSSQITENRTKPGSCSESSQ